MSITKKLEFLFLKTEPYYPKKSYSLIPSTLHETNKKVCNAALLRQTLHTFYFTWRRPTLAETKSQLPSALESLTTVFGMGTGVTFPPSLPDIYL